MSDYIIGRNPVREAMRAGRTIDKIFMKTGECDGSLKKIAGAAKAMGITVLRVDRKKLDPRPLPTLLKRPYRTQFPRRRFRKDFH